MPKQSRFYKVCEMQLRRTNELRHFFTHILVIWTYVDLFLQACGLTSLCQIMIGLTLLRQHNPENLDLSHDAMMHIPLTIRDTKLH